MNCSLKRVPFLRGLSTLTMATRTTTIRQITIMLGVLEAESKKKVCNV